MSDIASLRAELDAARAELLAALDGIGEAESLRTPPGAASPDDARWPVRDVLWHVGLSDDFVRRWIDASRRGVAPPVPDPRRRPPHMETPALLRAWLGQSRHATLVLIAKLADDALDAPRPTADGGERSYADALAFLAKHDRDHAAQVRDLRGAEGQGSAAGG